MRFAGVLPRFRMLPDCLFGQPPRPSHRACRPLRCDGRYGRGLRNRAQRRLLAREEHARIRRMYRINRVAGANECGLHFVDFRRTERCLVQFHQDLRDP